MRVISSKEFATQVDDLIAETTYEMLVKLMGEFERKGYVRVSPMAEYSIEADTEEAAEILKEHVYLALVTLGLDVKGDGREW